MYDSNVQSVGLWDERDRKKNSTFRELKAILFALQSLCSRLRNEKVKVFSNSRSHYKCWKFRDGIAVTIFQLYLSGGSVDS